MSFTKAVSVGGTYNIGNYESVRVEVMVEREKDEYDPNSLYQHASDLLRELVNQEIKRRRE